MGQPRILESTHLGSGLNPVSSDRRMGTAAIPTSVSRVDGEARRYGFLFSVQRTMPGVDFTLVHRSIPIARVLDLLRFKPTRRRGSQLRGPCPLHGSKSSQSRSFSVNLANNAFRCFGCGAAGNQLDLWRRASNLPLREAAVDLCSRLHIPLPSRRAESRPSVGRTETGNP